MTKMVESFNPGWIRDIEESSLDDNFKKIFEFYVINCPCKKISSRGIDIENIWGKKVWKEKKLRSLVLENGELVPKENYSAASKIEEMSKSIATVNLNGTFQTKLNKNKVAFYNNNQPELMNILFYIRCSFAHGRFMIKNNPKKEKYYIMESGKRKDDKVELRARMILKEQTLLDWIEIIQNKK